MKQPPSPTVSPQYNYRHHIQLQRGNILCNPLYSCQFKEGK